jgi:hypothetical protein
MEACFSRTQRRPPAVMFCEASSSTEYRKQTALGEQKLLSFKKDFTGQ